MERSMPAFLRRVAFVALCTLIASSAMAQDAASRAPAPDSRPGVAVGIHELSPWTMFLDADLVVKAIMIGLAFASLVTWTIFVGKFIELFVARRRVTQSLAMVTQARSLGEASENLHADKSVTRMFVVTAINEARLSSGTTTRPASRTGPPPVSRK